ncbi:MAG: hypothetical protein ACRCVT_08995 [Leadbetterella sp.]
MRYTRILTTLIVFSTFWSCGPDLPVLPTEFSKEGNTTPPPTATNPPATNPPGTNPPVTNPPVTNPPVTNPPVTNPPANNNSVIVGKWKISNPYVLLDGSTRVKPTSASIKEAGLNQTVIEFKSDGTGTFDGARITYTYDATSKKVLITQDGDVTSYTVAASGSTITLSTNPINFAALRDIEDLTEDEFNVVFSVLTLFDLGSPDMKKIEASKRVQFVMEFTKQ